MITVDDPCMTHRWLFEPDMSEKFDFDKKWMKLGNKRFYVSWTFSAVFSSRGCLNDPGSIKGAFQPLVK